MGLYADLERGRYPVWQNMDYYDLLHGSGILFVTVTVGLVIIRPLPNLFLHAGRFLEEN
jgi:hypothetical protein